MSSSKRARRNRRPKVKGTKPLASGKYYSLHMKEMDGEWTRWFLIEGHSRLRDRHAYLYRVLCSTDLGLGCVIRRVSEKTKLCETCTRFRESNDHCGCIIVKYKEHSLFKPVSALEGMSHVGK